MKRLPWAFLVVLATIPAASAVSTGCGSDNPDIVGDDDGGDANSGFDANNNNNNNNGDSGGGGFIDALVDAERSPDAAVCVNAGTACTSSLDCCSANCNAGTHVCDNPVVGGGGGGGGGGGTCKLPGVACSVGPDCCTLSCIGGTCSNLHCVADNQACGSNAECCGGNCAPNGTGGGVCKPLNGTGPATDGNPCTASTQCASQNCQNGVCAPSSSTCQQNGDVCSTDANCCGGLCTIAAGQTLGTCSSVNGGGTVGGACLPAGEVCSPAGTCGNENCCSRSCAPDPFTGKNVCQPETGCHLVGDLCKQTSDCCGVKDVTGSFKCSPDQAGYPNCGPSTDVQCQKQAGQTFGVCNYATTVCTPAGDICKPGLLTTSGAESCTTKADCCGGNDNTNPTCQIDRNGIPRCCIGECPKCVTPVPAGTQCASTADCCGQPCVVNTDPGTSATKPFVCSGTACQQQGSACSSNADCCGGVPCALPPGASTGLCGGTVLPDGGVSPDGGGGVVTQDGGTAGDAGSGTCALYGQVCILATDCCSGVPCTNGTCHYP